MIMMYKEITAGYRLLRWIDTNRGRIRRRIVVVPRVREEFQELCDLLLGLH